MRNDHSIAGTTILQTTLEDADNTQFYFKRLNDFFDLTLIVKLKNVCGMGDPRHEVRHSESGFRGEDVSPSTASSVLQLETIKSFTELIGKETMVYGVWMIVRPYDLNGGGGGCMHE